jgi:hypothetical protein
VEAAASPRIAAAHRALAAELRLFMLHLRPVWTPEQTVEHHERLIRELRTDGEDAVRRHLEEGEAAVRGGRHRG